MDSSIFPVPPTTSPPTASEPATDVRDFKSDINLMQTVYGILLILGFRQLGDAFFDYMSGERNVWVMVTLTGSGLALAFLGFRFFWAVGNIRRYIIYREKTHPALYRRLITTIQFPVLLLHAMAFYFLCRLHANMKVPKDFESGATIFVLGYCGFLLGNSLWLKLLVRNRPNKVPEEDWVRNNGAFAIVALFVFFGTLSYGRQIAFVSCCLVFLGNSFVDLWKTADTYIAKSTEKA